MSTSGHGNKENGSVVWQTGSTDVSDGASGKHSGVWAPDGLTHRSASDKCRTDSSGLYEPGADRKAEKLLGNRSASGAAGIDADQELARTDALISAAKEKGIIVLALHTGGSARRGTLSDSFITPAFQGCDAADPPDGAGRENKRNR